MLFGGASYGDPDKIQLGAKKNRVKITSSEVKGMIFGGDSWFLGANSDANENKVEIISSKISKQDNSLIDFAVVGGISTNNATNNTVSITSSNIGGEIYGGKSEDKNANENKVSLKISSVGSSVAGGSAKNEANNNILDITSSNIGDNVYGGYSNEGNAINNTINLFHNSGRDIATLGNYFLVKGIIHGGLSDGNKDAISGNTLNVTGKDLIAGNIKKL